MPAKEFQWALGRFQAGIIQPWFRQQKPARRIAFARHVFEHGLFPGQGWRLPESLSLNRLAQQGKRVGKDLLLLGRRFLFQRQGENGKEPSQTGILHERPQERGPFGKTFIQSPQFVDVEIQQSVFIEKIILLGLIHRRK